MGTSIDYYHNKNVLITGGLGLIGSTIAIKLVNLGANVTILDAKLSRYGNNLFNIRQIQDKVKLVEGDIRDEKLMGHLVKPADVIFNLAAQIDYNYSLDNPFLDLDINCRGHLVVLEACRKYNPKAKLVFSGSRMEYGKITKNPVSENHPAQPLSVYAIHKLTGEKYYQAYYNHFNINSVCFRITNPYGPRSQMKHPGYSIVNWFIRQAMEGKEISIFGDGSQIRDYIYVQDVVEAMVIAASNDKANGQIYNLGSGKPTKFIDMAKKVLKTVGKGSLILQDWPKNWKHVETGDFYSDMRKFKKTFDWEPQVMLDDGIKKTVEYYTKYKKEYW